MIPSIFFILGLAVGSFVNALVWRLRQQEISNSSSKASLKTKELSIVSGRSMCPWCRHGLAWHDLVPVISWLWLRGRCRYCHKQISVQYPLVEIATALIFWMLYEHIGLGSNLGSVELVFWCLSSISLLALFTYDLLWQILPNKLTYPLIATSLVFIAAVYAFEPDKDFLVSHILGGLSLVSIFAAIFYGSKGNWLGGGDVKLVAFIGLALGWQKGWLAVVLAAWIGLFIYAGIGLVTRKSVRNLKLPFGSLLIVATYISLFVGDELVSWYLSLYGL